MSDRLPDLLHGQEKQVWGDCAYASQQALISAAAPAAQDLTNQLVRKGSITEAHERLVNRAKSRVRARVEHVFAVVKRLWGFDKVRYRGRHGGAGTPESAAPLRPIAPQRPRMDAAATASVLTDACSALP